MRSVTMMMMMTSVCVLHLKKGWRLREDKVENSWRMYEEMYLNDEFLYDKNLKDNEQPIAQPPLVKKLVAIYGEVPLFLVEDIFDSWRSFADDDEQESIWRRRYSLTLERVRPTGGYPMPPQTNWLEMEIISWEIMKNVHWIDLFDLFDIIMIVFITWSSPSSWSWWTSLTPHRWNMELHTRRREHTRSTVEWRRPRVMVQYRTPRCMHPICGRRRRQYPDRRFRCRWRSWWCADDVGTRAE